jgi:hypothetical protein
MFSQHYTQKLDFCKKNMFFHDDARELRQKISKVFLNHGAITDNNASMLELISGINTFTF